LDLTLKGLFMKKIFGLFLALISLSAVNAFSDPIAMTMVFTCPCATGTGPGTLVNFGANVGGYGGETINGTAVANPPYFKGAATANLPGNIPDGDYTSSGTTYDYPTGTITCKYSSATYSEISVSYEMINTAGIQVVSNTSDSITLNQFIGLDA
jgi:hypothetical protein